MLPVLKTDTDLIEGQFAVVMESTPMPRALMTLTLNCELLSFLTLKTSEQQLKRVAPSQL
jgi:hypothetical protein